MRFRSWPVLVFGFGVLLLLMAVSGLATWSETRRLYANWQSLDKSYQDGERSLQQIRSDIQVSGLLARDYLLDPSPAHASSYKTQLLANRAEMNSQLERLERTIAHEHQPKLTLLGAQLQSYWDSLGPIFSWTPAQEQSLSPAFLRNSAIPRRDAAMALAKEIERLNEENHGSRQKDIEQSQAHFESAFSYAALLSMAVGLLVSIASVARISELEGVALRQHLRTEEAERQLRDLSQQLVKAQEEERRSISRELHDEVGQMLTGLRMDLSNLQRFDAEPAKEFEIKLQECRILLEQTVQSVRDLAMGLRPSMLDDLGLGAALEWQAREFARRYDIPVNLELDAPLDRLTETQKVSIYRVVQEALTNCARHARAKSIGIRLNEDGSTLKLAVADDGIGMAEDGGKASGIGLTGIQERVRELGGAFSILSAPQHGTTLSVMIPLRTAQL
ncbi:MAG: sensor histidine kinase [Bryobacterales bacterium]|nr:sensor histidine kinase [Bryobacterales bacterium]